MAASPLAALDPPRKVLVRAGAGQTMVSYYAPAELAARHQLSAELAGNLAGIDAPTDALIAPGRREHRAAGLREPAGRGIRGSRGLPGVVGEVGAQPAFGFGEADALPPGVVLGLVLAYPPDGEVPR